MAMWWALPQFRGVEVWPGRGFLVELPDGQVEFVRDIAASHPPDHQADARFFDPPPTLRRPEPARAIATTRVRRRPVPRPDDAWYIVDERANVARRDPRAAEQLPYRDQPATARRRTAERARSLLLSLLDLRQQRELSHLGHFWVHGPFGSIRLGRVYDLVHRSRSHRHVERRLCVVTRAHGDIPPDDEWTSIVLTLAHDPEQFFRVANLRRVIDQGTNLRGLRAALDDAIATGDPQAAVFAANDLGVIADPRLLVEASTWVESHARLDATNADRYRQHHQWLIDPATRAATTLRANGDGTLGARRFAIHSA